MMKRIIAAVITSVLLCSGVAAHAQQPAQQPVVPPPGTPTAGAPAALDPRLDVDKLKPNQREYLLMAMLSRNPMIVPEQLNKVKGEYEKMQPEMQLQMLKPMVQRIQELPPAIKDPILNNMPPPQ